MNENATITHRGGCHCGRVRFEVRAPAAFKASQCNCSICNMNGYQHLIVRQEAFKLLEGKQELTEYRFNSGVARHYFCRHCGIKSFYVPRSHPHGISVNVRCLDHSTIKQIEFVTFDGRRWEKNVAGLANVHELI